MGGLRYDLHIHSSLSPCADDNMTPSTIAGFCKLAGADVIAVCDHNSALNLPAVKACCDAYDIRLIPGIEVNTQEEIHLLCYFHTVEAALKMGKIIYDALPPFPASRYKWGKQLVIDESDVVVDEVEKMLSSACALNIYEVARLCREFGGTPVPAHVDRDSYSVLAVLGVIPEELEFSAVEVARPEKLPELMALGQIPPGTHILSSSDAHAIEMLRDSFHELPEGCFVSDYLK